MKSLNIRALIGMMAVSLAGLATAAPVYFEEGFDKTTLPAGMTVSGEGEAYTKSVYKQSKVKDEWHVGVAGIKGNAMIVPTYTGRPNAIFSRTFTLPSFTPEAGAILRWQARSMMGDFPEAYEVWAVGKSGDRTPLLSIDEEAGWWTWHLVNLDNFAGKEITVEFKCVSKNRYMLCIDDIYAGVPDEPKLEMTAKNPVFQSAMEDGFVEVMISNWGKAVELRGVKAVAAETSVNADVLNIEPGENATVTIPVAPEMGQRVNYAISAYDGEKEISLGTTEIYYSNFRRNHLIDKATGGWCNNCPEAIVSVQGMKRTYGDQLIMIEPHAYPSTLNIQDYWSYLKFYAAPYFMTNRNQNFKYGKWNDNVSKGLYLPVKAELLITQAIYDPEANSVKATCEVRFAEDADNSTNRYRIGYAFTENLFDENPASGYTQSNACTMPAHEEYYHLPSTVPSFLTVYHNVNRTGAIAHEGLENILPAALTQEKQQIELTVPVSADVQNPSKARMAVYIIDTESEGDKVLNADSREIPDMLNTSINRFDSEQIEDLDATPEYYDMQGHKVKNPQQGIYIMRRGSISRKVVIK